jgi:N-glycosylase/DNA lyase
LYYVHSSDVSGSENVEWEIRNYFQLEVSLEDLKKSWADSNFLKKNLMGLRVTRQDPLETTIAFICSSNNNIKRITLMISRLLEEYGHFRGRVEGRDYYSFPLMSSLVGDNVHDKLRELGFGYRSKFVVESARFILSKNQGWLNDLRWMDEYKKARQELMQLHGVGRKVADCICLFSLDFPEVVPVDTHVHQMAVRDYGLKIPNKSLTEKNYEKIQDCFTRVFGRYAGMLEVSAILLYLAYLAN